MSYRISDSDLTGRPFKGALADNNEFPVLHSTMEAPKWMVALDWDGATKENVWQDIQTVQAILPEAGRAAIYITGHGYHAVFEHECRREDVQTLLQIVSRPTPSVYKRLEQDDETVLKELEIQVTMRGSVCSGYVSIALQRGLKIRVGRKPGRAADMMRITPRSQADSPLLRAHDAALRKYKVVHNYPRGLCIDPAKKTTLRGSSLRLPPLS